MSWYSKTKLKRPYRVYMRCPNVIKHLEVVNVEQSNDKTEERQAKAIVKKKFLGIIEDWRQIGCTLVATLDNKEWERRVKAEETKKQMEEENIQNAWWQD